MVFVQLLDAETNAGFGGLSLVVPVVAVAAAVLNRTQSSIQSGIQSRVQLRHPRDPLNRYIQLSGLFSFFPIPITLFRIL